MQLNEAQRAAAAHDQGHALVLAGAGTGKTSTLIARACELLKRGVKPEQMIMVTFTRRATREIRERMVREVGDIADQVRIGTFHRICLDIMRIEPESFEMRGFTVIDEDDREQLMRLARGALLPNDANERNNTLPKAAQLVTWLSYARNANIPVSDYLKQQKIFDEKQLNDVLAVYEAYEARKQRAHYLDYDDILRRCTMVLVAKEAVRKRIMARFTHVLVDEIQDTSALQWLLLRAMRHHAQIYCVGDDAQSIYAFRGADFRTVHNFADIFKIGPNRASTYRLTENYRSTQEILDVSNWLLEQSPLPYKKKLYAARGSGTVPVMVDCDDDLAQGLWIANDVAQRQAAGLALSEMVVLVRTAYAARPIESALIERNIPYVFVGGTSLLKAAHVRDLLALLRVRVNLNDDVAWMRYLTFWKGVGDRTAERWVQQISACESIEQAAEFLYRTKPEPGGPAMPLMHLINAAPTPVAQVEAAMQALDPLLSVKYQYEQWEQRRRDLELLARVAQRFRSLDAFIEEFVLDPLHASLIAPPSDALVLATVHAAKGTEADVVYVARLDAGQYPHSRAQSDEEFEEERRVLYVALTRAKNELFMVRAPEMIPAWGSQPTFVEGMPEGLIRRVQFGQRRREVWDTLKSLDGVIPDIDDV